MQWHFAGKCFRHKNSTIKNKQLKHEQNLLSSLKKRVMLILADYSKQRLTKLSSKFLSMGKICYMIVLNGQCHLGPNMTRTCH